MTCDAGHAFCYLIFNIIIKQSAVLDTLKIHIFNTLLRLASLDDISPDSSTISEV